MVCHFGCELHERYSLSHMKGGKNKDGGKGQNTENYEGKKTEKEREADGKKSRDRKGIQWTVTTAEGRKKKGREVEKQLSSCPSLHAARTPPWGDSDFKPLPCFIFPWLLQPDQSSKPAGVTQPSSFLPGPQSHPHRV